MSWFNKLKTPLSPRPLWPCWHAISTFDTLRCGQLIKGHFVVLARKFKLNINEMLKRCKATLRCRFYSFYPKCNSISGSNHWILGFSISVSSFCAAEGWIFTNEKKLFTKLKLLTFLCVINRPRMPVLNVSWRHSNTLFSVLFWFSVYTSLQIFPC